MTATHRPSRISHRISLVALLATFASLLGVQTACNTYPKGPINVPLEYRPQRSGPITGSLPEGDVRVHLEAVSDKRQDKDQIGRNVEDETPLPAYASGKSPAEFVHDVLKTELEQFGYQLVDAPEAADRIIAVDLTKFWCEEESTFESEVNGTVVVKDKSGKAVWRGKMAGAAETFGRSRSPVNYQETLSDATKRAVASVIGNGAFTGALSR